MERTALHGRVDGCPKGGRRLCDHPENVRRCARRGRRYPGRHSDARYRFRRVLPEREYAAQRNARRGVWHPPLRDPEPPVKHASLFSRAREEIDERSDRYRADTGKGGPHVRRANTPSPVAPIDATVSPG